MNRTGFSRGNFVVHVFRHYVAIVLSLRSKYLLFSMILDGFSLDMMFFFVSISCIALRKELFSWLN